MNKGTIFVNKFEKYPMSVAKAVQASRKILPDARMKDWLRERTEFPNAPSDISGLVSKKNPGGPSERLASGLLEKFKQNGWLYVDVPVLHDNDKYILAIINMWRGTSVRWNGVPLRAGDTVLDLKKVVDEKNGAACTFGRYSFDGISGEQDGMLPLLFFANLLNKASPNQEFLPAIRMLEQNIAKEYGVAIPTN